MINYNSGNKLKQSDKFNTKIKLRLIDTIIKNTVMSSDDILVFF